MDFLHLVLIKSSFSAVLLTELTRQCSLMMMFLLRSSCGDVLSHTVHNMTLKSARLDVVNRSPALIGCFVVDRRYFEEIGLLDEGMEVYGGENVELGIRVRRFCVQSTVTNINTHTHSLIIDSC